jgi:hypothetical protein
LWRGSFYLPANQYWSNPPQFCFTPLLLIKVAYEDRAESAHNEESRGAREADESDLSS